jgi:hypothetical protein
MGYHEKPGSFAFTSLRKVFLSWGYLVTASSLSINSSALPKHVDQVTGALLDRVHVPNPQPVNEGHGEEKTRTHVKSIFVFHGSPIPYNDYLIQMSSFICPWYHTALETLSLNGNGRSYAHCFGTDLAELEV